MKHKLFYTALLLIPFILTSCQSSFEQQGYTKKGVKYENYVDDVRYDKQLFYKNNDKIVGADPSVITVGDTYYLYVTNALASGDTSYIQGFKSKNLSDWDYLGNVFVPNRHAWAVYNLWAPEVIEYQDKFYMYYSGHDTNKGEMGIGLAISDNPAGPFKEYEGTLANGTVINHTKTPFNFGFKMIDPSIFIEDDHIYMYVSKDQVEGKSSIYGVELETDMVSVKPGSLVGPLVEPSQEWENPHGSSKWNEGPFVVKHQDTYYLTYSANYYSSLLYSVGYATADHPLGPYTKSDQNPILAATEELSYISGPGHNSMFYSIDHRELFIAYHSHIDVDSGGSQRKINFDRVRFNDGAMEIIGPSYGPQLLPSGSGKYGDISHLATVSSNQNRAVDRLIDGHINFDINDVAGSEYLIDKSEAITFTFDQSVDIYAILVYDSADYELSGTKYSLKFDQDEIKDVYFNPNYKFLDRLDYEIKIPGTASIIQFEKLTSKTIQLKFNKGISLSEIIIVGEVS